MVGRRWGRCVRLSFRINWDSFIGDFSDVSVVVVGSVLHMLGATIGKSN